MNQIGYRSPKRTAEITGGVGQPLSLLLKCNPLIDQLALYDIKGATGVAADLSHINTKARVMGHSPPEGLQSALDGAKLVVITASGLLQQVVFAFTKAKLKLAWNDKGG